VDGRRLTSPSKQSWIGNELLYVIVEYSEIFALGFFAAVDLS
jgi:hypothetical protein